MDKNPYTVLDLPKNCTEQEIRIRYKQLVKKYHPDKNGEGSRELFEAVERAYTLLTHSDPEKRYKIEGDHAELKEEFEQFKVEGECPEENPVVTIDKELLRSDKKNEEDEDEISRLERERNHTMYVIPKMFNEFSPSIFNQLFNDHKNRKTAIVQHNPVKQSSFSSLLKESNCASIDTYSIDHYENPDPNKTDLNRFTEREEEGKVKSIDVTLFDKRLEREKKAFEQMKSNEEFIETEKTFFDLN